MDLAEIRQCREITEAHIAEAIETRDDTRALLEHAASISAPRQGGSRILLIFARIASSGSDWLDGALRVEVRAVAEGSLVDVYAEIGAGLRERVLPSVTMRVPIEEFLAAIKRVPQAIAPLSVVEPAAGSLVHLVLRAGEVPKTDAVEREAREERSEPLVRLPNPKPLSLGDLPTISAARPPPARPIPKRPQIDALRTSGATPPARPPPARAPSPRVPTPAWSSEERPVPLPKRTEVAISPRIATPPLSLGDLPLVGAPVVQPVVESPDPAPPSPEPASPAPEPAPLVAGGTTPFEEPPPSSDPLASDPDLPAPSIGAPSTPFARIRLRRSAGLPRIVREVEAPPPFLAVDARAEPEPSPPPPRVEPSGPAPEPAGPRKTDDVVDDGWE